MCVISIIFSSRRRHTRYWRDWSSTCALPICPAELQRLRTLRELLGAHDVSLNDVGFALRLRREQPLSDAVEAWFEAEIGRASCRERVEISVVAVSLTKKLYNVHARKQPTVNL